MLGGSIRKGNGNSEEGQLLLAGKLALMGKSVEEVVLELSSQLCVEEKDELPGQP